MPDLTVASAARAAGVSERTMRRWIREGRLTDCYKVGGRVRIPERALREAAVPYGTTDPEPMISRGPTDAELLRARLAFERIDEIRGRGRPPAGPDDTAATYVREWRDGPPRWDPTDDPE